ncbi:unnamed protein product, partial [Brenthis ino]
MELTLVLLLLHIASGLCINLQSLESFLEKNAELQINDKAEQRPVNELNDNPEQVNPGRRIFKVLPFKSNKKWNTKYQSQPDKSPLTENIPIAIIVAAKRDQDESKINTEYAYPRQTSEEEVIDIKKNKTLHLTDNISPSSTLNTAKSGMGSSNDVKIKHAIDHVNEINKRILETIATRNSTQHPNKDLKEKSLEIEKSIFSDKINKDLNEIEMKKNDMIPKLNITDKKAIEGNNSDGHYYDGKLVQMKNDKNIASEEKEPIVLKSTDDLIHEIETKFIKPTSDNKNELDDVIKDYIDESKIIVGPNPHKDIVYKDFNLIFIFNK